MATTNEIPLHNYPESFYITLDQVDYGMSTYWCNKLNCWIVNITTAEGVDVLTGVPLIPGVDLLAQYPDLGFKGQLTAQVDHDSAAVPSLSGLGFTGHLYYTTP